MTKEQILDKHLKTLIENDKDAWFRLEEMKTMPEYKAVLNAMTELETELVKNNAVLPLVSGSTLHPVGKLPEGSEEDVCYLCRYKRQCSDENGVYERCLSELKDSEYYR